VLGMRGSVSGISGCAGNRNSFSIRSSAVGIGGSASSGRGSVVDVRGSVSATAASSLPQHYHIPCAPSFSIS
jgi:hypothetical protein